MPTIAVVGEVVADAVLPPDGIIDGVAHLTVHPGGGPANTAVALSRLGTTARFAGRLSSGALGALCRAKLEQSTSTSAPRSPRSNRPPWPLPGSTTAALRPTSSTPTAPPTGVDRRLPRPTHRRALPRQQPAGSDTHRHPRPGAATLRPGHREPAGPGPQPTHRIHRPEPADTARAGSTTGPGSTVGPDWRTSCAYPRTTSSNSGRALHRRRPRCTCTPVGYRWQSSASGRRSFASLRSQTVRIPALHTTLVDTVGAGDSFHGGLLHHLAAAGHLGGRLDTLTLDGLTAALTFASRVAAITCSRAGANPPWAAELDSPERFSAPPASVSGSASSKENLVP